eukprot:superscaffoldBa00004805_g19472
MNTDVEFWYRLRSVSKYHGVQQKEHFCMHHVHRVQPGMACAKLPRLNYKCFSGLELQDIMKQCGTLRGNYPAALLPFCSPARGGMERWKEDRPPGRETWSRSIFPSSLSVMSSHSSERTPGGCPRGAACETAGGWLLSKFHPSQECGARTEEQGKGGKKQSRGPSGEADSASSPRRASEGGRIQALSMHNALEASFY